MTATPKRSPTELADHNELEHIRIHLGISRPQLLRVVGAYERQVGVFFASPEQIPPIYLSRARALLTLYETWRDQILHELNGQNTVTAKALATLLGTYPMKIHYLRHNSLLGSAGPRGHNTSQEGVVTPGDVRRLFEYNEKVLLSPPLEDADPRARHKRAPLGSLFLTWAMKEHPALFIPIDTDKVVPSYSRKKSA